jgi:hypothetical protein
MAIPRKQPALRASTPAGSLPDIPHLPPSLAEDDGFVEWDRGQRAWWDNVRAAVNSTALDTDRRTNRIEKSITVGLNTLSASFTEQIELVVDDLGALATRTTSLETSVNTPTTGLLARVSTIETTYATDAEVSSSISTAISAEVTARDTAITTAVNIEASARATADGLIHARWGVNIDVNGRIAGRINLDGTNASSTFLVAVDKFVVENANGTITAMDIRTGGKIVFGADIQSDNYVAATSGWRIERAGNAELNNVTVRGTLYSSAGTIGGFTLASNSFSAGSGGNKIEIASDVGTKGFGLRVGVTGAFTHHAEIDKNGITGFYYDTLSDEGGFQLRNVDATSGTNDGTLTLYDNGGSVAIRLRAYDSSIMIDGVKVLGPQEPAIADIALSGVSYGPEAASIEDKINAILAAMRAHGLIDT